jgi:hypothetical protein
LLAQSTTGGVEIMPYTNYISILEKNGKEESANGIDFDDIDFSDPSLEAIQIITPRSMYRLVIQDSGFDSRRLDSEGMDEIRRETFRYSMGGKSNFWTGVEISII